MAASARGGLCGSRLGIELGAHAVGELTYDGALLGGGCPSA